MKTTQRIAAAVMAALSTGLAAEAAIVVPGANGSDGELLINQNTVIDLSQAATGQWDNDNSSNAGKGVYDPEKWAVVFKFSSVTITGGATVTFKNHPSRAPVVWLVSGDVVVDPGSVVNLNGQNAPDAPYLQLAEPGPGGFRGGGANQGANGTRASAGFGPGGGAAGGYNGKWTPGRSAGYGSVSSFWDWDVNITGGNPDYSYNGVYGNPSLVPLIGGSGGAAFFDGSSGAGGGAGGGAMLLAAQGTIRLGGSMLAIGGAGHRRWDWEDWAYRGNGSGGGIRLLADNVVGNGVISVLGGEYWNAGGHGRIRVERVSTDGALSFAPPSPSVVPLQSGDTAQIWMPSAGPSVKIVSIAGVTAPADPRANFGGAGADVSLPQTSTVTVLLETTNVEDGAKVRLRCTPRINAQVLEREATLQEVVSTSPRVTRWVVEIPVGGGYAALQARVVRP